MLYELSFLDVLILPIYFKNYFTLTTNFHKVHNICMEIWDFSISYGRTQV